MDDTSAVDALANREVSCVRRALQHSDYSMRTRMSVGRTDGRKRVQPLPSLFNTALRFEYSAAFQFNEQLPTACG